MKMRSMMGFGPFGLVARAPENGDGGGGSGGTGQGGGESGAQSGQQQGGNQGGAGGEGGNGGQDGGAQSGAQPYFPTGLSDNFKGASDRETIDKMAQGLETYRKKAGDVPADATGYRDFGEIAPEVKQYYDSVENDELFAQLAERAHGRKMPKSEFQAVVKDFFELAAEHNLLEPAIDPKAEIAALVPEGAKHLPEAEQRAAVDKRMNDNIAWVNGLKAQGLEAESAEYMTLMLADSAKGHKALEWFRGRMEGTHRAGPGGGSGDGGGSGGGRLEQVKAQLNDPKHIPGRPGFDRKSYDGLMEEMKRLTASN